MLVLSYRIASTIAARALSSRRVVLSLVKCFFIKIIHRLFELGVTASSSRSRSRAFVGCEHEVPRRKVFCP